MCCVPGTRSTLVLGFFSMEVWTTQAILWCAAGRSHKIPDATSLEWLTADVNTGKNAAVLTLHRTPSAEQCLAWQSDLVQVAQAASHTVSSDTAGKAQQARHSTAQHSRQGTAQQARHSTAGKAQQARYSRQGTAKHSAAQRSSFKMLEYSRQNLQGLAPLFGRMISCQQSCVGGHVRLKPGCLHLLKDVPCLLPSPTCCPHQPHPTDIKTGIEQLHHALGLDTPLVRFDSTVYAAR